MRTVEFKQREGMTEGEKGKMVGSVGCELHKEFSSSLKFTVVITNLLYDIRYSIDSNSVFKHPPPQKKSLRFF